MLPTFVCPLYVCMPLRGVHTPHISPYSSVHLYVLRGFCMLWGVVRGLLHVRYILYTSPCMGVSPLMFIPTHPLASLCIGMFWGYLYVIWGIFPLCWGFWGCSPVFWGFGGISLFLYILVVHYVSHFYYGYDYYSSSYGGVFWAVIHFISDCGSFPDWAFYNIESVWNGSTSTLDARRIWRCYWPCLCATAATPIFDASSGLCKLCYGFSTGRFLFQS